MEAVPLKKANELAATNPSHKTPIPTINDQ